MSAFFMRRDISLCLQMACYDALQMVRRCGRLSNCESLRLLTQPIGYVLVYQRLSC
jgi:hypothetical protein